MQTEKIATYINVEDKQHSLLNKYYYRQPDGYSCGASSVKIVSNLYNVTSKDTDIELLKSICKTNPETGTIETGIISGLTYLGLPFQRTNDIIQTIQQDEVYLNNILSNNFIYVMRTLLYGIKHWVVLYEHNNGYYTTLDPSFGIINYHKSFILKAHELREFDGFTILKEKLKRKN